MHCNRRVGVLGIVVLAFVAGSRPGQAATLRVTVENLAPANSVALAPLRFGFGRGAFDSFDAGQTAFLLGSASIADAPIVSVAEGGSGATWLPAFQTAEPTANLGSVTGPVIGPFLPGERNSAVFQVEPTNRYFTFAAMVVPSNDHFLGNDDPRAFEVFDSSGNLLLTSITQFAGDIWDAGSETEHPANAAFLVDGIGGQRENEDAPVAFNFADLAAFDGLTTAAGYAFDHASLAADTPVLRISLTLVPELGSAALATAGGCGLLTTRRRRSV